MAKFKILTSFKLTGRGLVIVGDIMQGEINVGDWITFQNDQIQFRKEILCIEMVDKIAENISHFGLILNYETEEEKHRLA